MMLGQFEDDFTGIVQNRFREYSPNKGRYLTADPLGIKAGLNTFRYTPNPIDFIDPSGLYEVATSQAGEVQELPPIIVTAEREPMSEMPAGDAGGFGYDDAASIAVGALPVVGTGQSLVELISGTDYITGDPVHRGMAALGIFAGLVPGGKALLKGGAKWLKSLGRAATKQTAKFADEAKLLSHFEKHGAEFGAKTADEYLSIAQDVMKNGSKVEYSYKGEVRTGFVEFMGNNKKGQAKFAFVGTNNNGNITTLHTKSGKDFWKTLNGNSKDKTINPVD